MTKKKRNKVTARDRAHVKHRIRTEWAATMEDIANDAGARGFTSEQIAMLFFAELVRRMA